MRVVFIVYLFISTIYASDEELESSIFNKLVTAVTKKEKSKVYIHTKVESIKEHTAEFILVDGCEDADVVILSTVENIPQGCNKKILFGTRYSHLKDDRVVGAFFWQKGRPNILFYKNRLDKNNIMLNPSFDKYIEK